MIRSNPSCELPILLIYRHFAVGGLDDLVYHLHGHSFYVVGARRFGRSMSLHEVKSLDARRQLFARNLDCAPVKDTVVVPKFGAVALRFKADNPGKHALSYYDEFDINYLLYRSLFRSSANYKFLRQGRSEKSYSKISKRVASH